MNLAPGFWIRDLVLEIVVFLGIKDKNCEFEVNMILELLVSRGSSGACVDSHELWHRVRFAD